MEKRLIIAIALSLVVLLAFQQFSKKKAPETILPTAETPSVSGQAALPAKSLEPVQKETSVIPANVKEEITKIETEKFTLFFSNVGASIGEVFINPLNGKTEEGKEELLFKEEDPRKRLFAMTCNVLAGLDVASFQKKQGSDYIEYRYTQPKELEIIKRYSFDKSLDYINLDIIIKNLSSQRTALSYELVGPSNLEKSGEIAGRNFLQANIKVNGIVEKVGRVKNGTIQKIGEISWVALKGRHFTVICKPFNDIKAVSIQQVTKGNLNTKLESPSLILSGNEQIENKFLIYAGPLDTDKLKAVGYDLDSVVDYGFFGGLSKVLLKVLNFFHKVTRNWGIAIILLTILINIILFPLTFKSFASMQKMKKIQPHMQKLKEVHKDNPQKLNKEMMELYKQYNVNPLGGCLPLLLQMPIFISLYQGLMRSIQLKGASFLWIKDLSRPDAVSIPFTLPLIGNSINILPLLMVGMMVVQQKMTQMSTVAATDEQASQQKMMMIMMPIFFGFIFYRMPSGLVLYWLTNTILMTTEQKLIGRSIDNS